MMPDRVFSMVYFAGLLAGSAVRVVYSRRNKRNRIADEHETGVDMLLVSLPSLGMIVLPLVYALSPWLGFADYDLPLWASLAGVALYAAGMWLLWRSHVDLGRYWSPSLQIVEGHALVTQGVFGAIRHPMYAAHWLWAIAQPLLLHNWIAGLATLATFVPLYFYRVPREEHMMLEHFGAAYGAYMNRTGRVIPPLK